MQIEAAKPCYALIEEKKKEEEETRIFGSRLTAFEKFIIDETFLLKPGTKRRIEGEP